MDQKKSERAARGVNAWEPQARQQQLDEEDRFKVKPFPSPHELVHQAWYPSILYDQDACHSICLLKPVICCWFLVKTCCCHSFSKLWLISERLHVSHRSRLFGGCSLLFLSLNLPPIALEGVLVRCPLVSNSLCTWTVGCLYRHVGQSMTRRPEVCMSYRLFRSACGPDV